MPVSRCLCEWRGWIVVVLASLQFALAVGPVFNYHIFLLSFQEEFHTNTAITGWVGCIAHSLMSFGSIPAAALIRRLSPRAVILAGVFLHCGGFFSTAFVPSLGYAFLTYGAAVGIGTSFIVQGSYTLALMWFPTKHCARACATMNAGTPFGMLVSGPLLNMMISAHGWRHTFLMASSFIFVISAIAGLFMTTPTEAPRVQLPESEKRSPAEEEKLAAKGSSEGVIREEGEKDLTPSVLPLILLCRQWDAWLWNVGIAVGSIAWSFHAINLASFMDSIGLSEVDISLAVVALSAGQLSGKFLLAIFADSLPFLKLYLITASFITAGISSGFLKLASTLPPVLTLSFFFGMFRAGSFAMMLPSSVEIFSQYGMSVVTIFSLVPFGFGMLISAPLAGKSTFWFVFCFYGYPSLGFTSTEGLIQIMTRVEVYSLYVHKSYIRKKGMRFSKNTMLLLQIEISPVIPSFTFCLSSVGGLYDLTGDYILSLLTIMGLFLFACSCIVLIGIKRRINCRRKKEVDIVTRSNAYELVQSKDDNVNTTQV
ncbi:monocarboxylate transporter 5-like isoform X2 [Acanthaster planci]|uniref:Monocarboxylate transporter 5-like isoform X2 n=1 Tax=Acanthaster planci TaxID=133434 RepID=A0A8B7Y8C6_ACAPL|nr:monocarboxylate transporter 5-like isoform X2 [Acanthaster planci]